MSFLSSLSVSESDSACGGTDGSILSGIHGIPGIVLTTPGMLPITHGGILSGPVFGLMIPGIVPGPFHTIPSTLSVRFIPADGQEAITCPAIMYLAVEAGEKDHITAEEAVLEEEARE